MSAKMVSAFVDEFKKLKRNGEAAIAQLEDRDLFFRLNPQQNSIAVIVKHLHGNLLSRFTEFLTTDGEKPNRNREGEFAEEIVPRDQIIQWWDQGWDCLLGSLSRLVDDDLLKTVMIRKESFTVIGALARSLSHCAYHTGQILLLAKHIKGSNWKYLTIPPGGSAQFNQKMGMK